MKKSFIFIILIYICNFVFADNIRKPAVAGFFYPSDKKELKEQINDFLKISPQNIEGDIFALIVPHAGYIYSGSVAGYAYKAIENKKFDTVILIGSSHRYSYEGISVFSNGYFETPLGKVEIDKEISEYLIKHSKYITANEKPHIPEHSLEVQIPFLQEILSNFKIVPILFGEHNSRIHNVLKNALVSVLKKSKKKILIIASSDMSHYHPQDVASKIDKKTLNLIERFAPEELWKNIERGEVELCGASAVITTMLVAKELNIEGIKILKYANSGDTGGDKNRVVGYTSVVMFNKKRSKKMKENEFNLSKQEKKILLNIARTTLENYLQNKKIPDFKITEKNLQEKCGAFVTLKKHGELRGCIGNMTSNEPIYKLVSEMAIASATQDSRFHSVSYKELKDIEIEISVLSPLKKIENIEEIKVGKHGIYIKKAFRTGVFLPQVAIEQGWGRDEFLRNLCSNKMGLNPECYKDKDAEIFIYTAIVFSEQEMK